MKLNPKKTKMNRSRAYYRSERDRHIRHNQHILYDVWHERDVFQSLVKDPSSKEENRKRFDLPGRLAKGKVHCSCWLCSFHGQPMQDVRNLMRLNYVD